MYAVYPFSFGSDVGQNIVKALEKYRERLQQEPKSIIINTLLLEKAKAFVTDQGITIDLEGRWGCLSWEVWLEV